MLVIIEIAHQIPRRPCNIAIYNAVLYDIISNNGMPPEQLCCITVDIPTFLAAMSEDIGL